MRNNVHVDGGGAWVAFALVLIAFYGEPDLVDALIAFLQAGAG